MAGVHGLCNRAPAFCQGGCAVVLSDGTVAEEGSPKDLEEKKWCVCPYGKTADRKPELETCVKKEIM